MIYFFYGDEEFNITEQIQKLKSGLDENFIEMSFKTYSNPSFPDLISIVRTQPMMFGKMLVVIDCLSLLSGKKSNESSIDDKQIKQLTEALDNVNENLDIVFKAILPKDSQKKIDKRKKIFKTLAKYNAQEFLQIPSYKTAELESWIITRANSKKMKISQPVAAQMLMQIGSDLRLLDTELEKLKIFANKESITVDTVKEICVTNEDLFVFVDCLAGEDIAKTLVEYRKLLMKKHPLEILSALNTMLHKKIQLKFYGTKFSPDEIAKMTNMHPYRVKIELGKLKNTSLKYLVNLRKNLTKAEYKIKSGQSELDIGKELEYAILQ